MYMVIHPYSFNSKYLGLIIDRSRNPILIVRWYLLVTTCNWSERIKLVRIVS